MPFINKKTTRFLWIVFVIALIGGLKLLFLRVLTRIEPRPMRTFRWRFGKVRYTVEGEGAPLLLIHGLGLRKSSQDWDEIIPQLTARYRVYAIDLPGFGCSETPAITYSAYLYASLIREFTVKVIKKKTSIIAQGQSTAYAVIASRLKSDCFDKILLYKPNERPRLCNLSLGKLTEWGINKSLTRFILGKGMSVFLHADIWEDDPRIIHIKRLNSKRIIEMLTSVQ